MANHNAAAAAHGHEHGHDGAHGVTVKGYVIGFILAVILTVIPFKIVMDGTMDKGNMLAITLGLDVVQIIVHLKFFLHLDGSKDQRGNVMAFLLTAVILLIIVAGSLWIMHNLNVNMVH